MADHLAHDHVGLAPARSAASGLALGSPERRARRQSRRHKLRGSAASSLLSSTDDDALVQQALVWSNSEGRQWGTSNVDEIPAVQFGAGDEAGKTASSLPSIRPSRDTVYRVIITIGAMLAGLLAATTQAFNTISKDVMLDTHTSNVFVSLLTGFGLAGLQFTLFAGISLDLLGAWRTCLIGNAFVLVGYFGMSYVSSPFLLVLLLSLVGLGSGAAFLSGFKTVIELGSPLGVGLTSCAMSASIFFTIFLKQTTLSITGCEGVTCWRQVVRADGIVCGVAFVLAALTFTLRSKVEGLDTPAAGRSRRASSVYSFGSGAFKELNQEPQSSLKQACTGCIGGLFVFKEPFFWRLAVADVAGLGCGIFVLASARQLWAAFDPTSDDSGTILKVFSLLAAIGNVGYPVLADFLDKRAVVSRVRLMGITLGVYGCVFTGIWLMTHLHGGGNPSNTMKWIMFSLMSSVGFGFGAALVGFPVCVSVAFPVEYFGTILSYVQMLASSFAVVAATLTAATYNATGSYTAMYFGMIGILFLGALLMCLPTSAVASTSDSQDAGTGGSARTPLNINHTHGDAVASTRVGYNSTGTGLQGRSFSKGMVHSSVL